MNDELFKVETLQDWQSASANQVVEDPDAGGASNSNSCCNNSADEP